MRVAQVLGGAVLLWLGLNSLPDLVGRIGQEDEFQLVGRAVFVGGELVVGAVLLVLAIRGLRRPVRETPGAEVE